MMIDDDTLKELLRIDDGLMQLCKWLNEQRETTIVTRMLQSVIGDGPDGQYGTARIACERSA
jgi:hypothetical protein